jgi:hypothetical protein
MNERCEGKRKERTPFEETSVTIYGQDRDYTFFIAHHHINSVNI